MQVQHKAGVHTATAHHETDPAVAAGEAVGTVLGPILFFGVPLFAAFVMWRFFRWFFRATR